MVLYTNSRNIGDVVIVECRGRIVFGEETTSLRLAVKDLLRKSNKIVLDLRNVSYLDSSGLGTVAGLYTSVANAGGTLKLACLRGAVSDLFDLSRLAKVVEIYDTPEAAAQSFGASA
jgi:anti-sigma B factor antagonist